MLSRYGPGYEVNSESPCPGPPAQCWVPRVSAVLTAPTTDDSELDLRVKAGPRNNTLHFYSNCGQILLGSTCQVRCVTPRSLNLCFNWTTLTSHLCGLNLFSRRRCIKGEAKHQAIPFPNSPIGCMPQTRRITCLDKLQWALYRQINVFLPGGRSSEQGSCCASHARAFSATRSLECCASTRRCPSSFIQDAQL